MRVLLLGGTGRLGRRLIPALVVHGHTVVAYVRSISKLQSIVTPALFDEITTCEGDALDSPAVEFALRKHDCDAIMNTAGDVERIGMHNQLLGRIAASVSSSAVRVGKDRGVPIRMWLIGGVNSLELPGSGGRQLQDDLGHAFARHHMETEEVISAVPTADLEWTLLCVAMMWPRGPRSRVIDLLPHVQHHNLTVAAQYIPEWSDRWVKYIPLIGAFLNVLLSVLLDYNTKYEDVADLVAEDLEKGRSSEYVGKFVGMKNVTKTKSA